MHAISSMRAYARPIFLNTLPQLPVVQSMLGVWQPLALARRSSFILLLQLIISTLYGSCICLISGHVAAAAELAPSGSVSVLNKRGNLLSVSSELNRRGKLSNSLFETRFNALKQRQQLQDDEDILFKVSRNVVDGANVSYRPDIALDGLNLQQQGADAKKEFNSPQGTTSSTASAILVVFTSARCPHSQEALREAQLAQKMLENLGVSLEVVNVKIKQKTEQARHFGIKNTPSLRLYPDANIQSAVYKTYEGADVTANEIAHWVLLHQGKVVQFTSVGKDTFREALSPGSPVGPVVHASVHEGSPRAALVKRLWENTEKLPSRFTLFDIKYVASSEEEEFRVYRKKLPFDVGEEEYLTLGEPEWDGKSILALLLEAENRKVYYGERPPRLLIGKRALLSVYVSRYENLQDIAWLLMEFYETYSDRIAFHIRNTTLKEAARSQDIFSHSWGGAVLMDQRASSSAYQKIAGVVRELSPFSQYSLSMPFNYHSLKSFLEDWSTGNAQLHFRSNRLSYTEKESHVMELNHHQFLKVLHRAKRVPLGVLYYKPECSDCEVYLSAWKEVAKVFNASEALKGQVLFGQVDGQVNDLIDFEMKEQIPSIAVYPGGSQALDKRILYTGPPSVSFLSEFLGALVVKLEEL